jgi:hypothetical protein
MPRGKPPKPELDSLDKALGSREEALAKYIRNVAALTPFEAFLGLDPPLKPGVFFQLQTMAVCDLFFDFEDSEIAKRLSVQEWKLSNLREHAYFGKVRDALQASAMALAGAASMDKMAEVAERAVASERLGMALDPSGDSREKAKALESFIDRRSARKGREGESAKVLLLPDGLLEMLRQAREMEDRFGRSEEKVINASIINVPRALPEGGEE